MDNVISYSLWGNDSKYVEGLVENLKLSPIIYPDWKVRVYIDDSVDITLMKNLQKQYPNLQVNVVMDKRGPYYGMYWRFFVNNDSTVDRFIVRDLDSRLNWRERAAVDEWIASGKDFHIMRDHPHHVYKIQGGMWGGVANKIDLIDAMNKHALYDRYCCDQNWLSSIIYDIIRDNVIVHDPFFDKKPFPPHLPIEDGGSFVGQIYINNKPQTP